MAEVSKTGKGGDWLLSMRTGMRPLGLRRRNHSFFCSPVRMSLGRWVRSSHLVCSAEGREGTGNGRT